MTVLRSLKPTKSHQDPLGYETFRPQLERVEQTFNSIQKAASSLTPFYCSPERIGHELNHLPALREKTNDQLAAWIVSKATEIAHAIIFDALSLILALADKKKFSFRHIFAQWAIKNYIKERPMPATLLTEVTAFSEEAKNAK